MDASHQARHAMPPHDLPPLPDVHAEAPSQAPACARCTGPVQMLRIREVSAKVGFSASTIHRLRQRGDFPAPLALSPNTAVWAEHELDAWLLARLAARGK